MEYDTSNLCTRCGADNSRDSYFCESCERYAAVRRNATVSRMVNLAPDDKGERVISMTQDEIMEAAERISARMEMAW